MSVYPKPINNSDVFNEKDYQTLDEYEQEHSGGGDDTDHSIYLKKSGGILSGNIQVPSLQFFDNSTMSTAFTSQMKSKLDQIQFDSSGNFITDKIKTNSILYESDPFGITSAQINNFLTTDKQQIISNKGNILTHNTKLTGISYNSSNQKTNINNLQIDDVDFLKSDNNYSDDDKAKLTQCSLKTTGISYDDSTFKTNINNLQINGVDYIKSSENNYTDEDKAKVNESVLKTTSISYDDSTFKTNINNLQLDGVDCIAFSSDNLVSLESNSSTLENITNNEFNYEINKKILTNTNDCHLSMRGFGGYIESITINDDQNFMFGLTEGSQILKLYNQNPSKTHISAGTLGGISGLQELIIGSNGIQLRRANKHIGTIGGLDDNDIFYINGNGTNDITIDAFSSNVNINSHLNINENITFSDNSEQTTAFTNNNQTQIESNKDNINSLQITTNSHVTKINILENQVSTLNESKMYVKIKPNWNILSEQLLTGSRHYGVQTDVFVITNDSAFDAYTHASVGLAPRHFLEMNKRLQVNCHINFTSSRSNIRTFRSKIVKYINPSNEGTAILDDESLFMGMKNYDNLTHNDVIHYTVSYICDLNYERESLVLQTQYLLQTSNGLIDLECQIEVLEL